MITYDKIEDDIRWLAQCELMFQRLAMAAQRLEEEHPGDLAKTVYEVDGVEYGKEAQLSRAARCQRIRAALETVADLQAKFGTTFATVVPVPKEPAA